MAKQGMKRPDITHTKPKNDHPPVPQLQGNQRTGKEKARPIVAGTVAPSQKVWHAERPISQAHGIIDTDLARDNLENHIPYADLQDL